MPSVTSIIHSNPHWNAYSGKPIDPADLTRAAERGKEVQRLCEQWDKDEIEVVNPKGEYVGYVEAWIQLREDTGLEVLSHEFEVELPNGVVGHPDMLCRMNGEIVLPDLKVTAQPLLAHEVQTVAYFMGIRNMDLYEYPQSAALFYLKDARKCSGNPYRIKRVKEQDIPHHWAAFTAMCRMLECQTILDKHHARYG